MKEDSLAYSARLGHLVRDALAVFTTDREAARKCLIDASALAFIEANLESKIAIPDLAGFFGVSKSHFSRAFKHSIGCPPMTYVCMRRVERVKLMMKSERQRLSEIALACGFADQSHLTRVFRKIVGVSPGVWRRHRETATP